MAPRPAIHYETLLSNPRVPVLILYLSHGYPVETGHLASRVVPFTKARSRQSRACHWTHAPVADGAYQARLDGLPEEAGA